MSIRDRYRFREGDRYQALREQDQQRVGQVVRWLKANPLSTAEEVYKAVGVSVMAATKYVKSCMYQGKRVWRVNHKKINQV